MIAFLLAACVSNPEAGPTPPNVGTPLPTAVERGDAPDFTFETPTGPFTLSEHAGDVLLIDIAGFT